MKSEIQYSPYKGQSLTFGVFSYCLYSHLQRQELCVHMLTCFNIYLPDFDQSRGLEMALDVSFL